MKTAEQVAKIIEEMKAEAVDPQRIAWEAAMACVGWAYVFGARGQYCTPSNRRARYSDAHPTIKTKCKNYNGSGSAGCSGCKWYPGNKYTRFFDCRGFTYWILKQVYSWELMGAGATSQWNDERNWKAKGTVAEGMPADTLVCLFVRKGKTMEHTGFGFNGETVECSNGVQYFSSMNKKWTDWGVPACIGGEVPTPTPKPDPEPAGKPTIRKGDRGEYVTLAQTMLLNRGYRLPLYGADGSFGAETQAAVRLFQQDWGLTVDGVIGPQTWQMLESTPSKGKTYRVTITGLDKTQAQAMLNNYPGATMAEEE